MNDIRKPTRRKPIDKKQCIIAFGILLGIFLTGCGAVEELTAVSTVFAKSSGDSGSMVWHGYIEALRSLDVVANTSGKVLSIEAEPGRRVESGDTLVMLDSADSLLQRKQAEAGLQVARTAAANAAAANDADTLVTPARIARDDARENLSRLQALFEASAIPEAELSAARSRLETAETQLQAAELNQRGAYASAMAQLSSAQVAVEIASKRVEDCVIAAPMDALVARVNVEPGAFISPQVPLIALIDDSRLQIKIQVMETDIGLLSPGMDMDIDTQADGKRYNGLVERIETMANTRTGMFDVIVFLRQTETPPRLGLTADVRLHEPQAADTVLIPKACVSAEEDVSVVYIVGNGAVWKHQVEVLEEQGAWLEVKGLNVGDEVVAGSSANLSEGQRVRVMNWSVDMPEE